MNGQLGSALQTAKNLHLFVDLGSALDELLTLLFESQLHDLLHLFRRLRIETLLGGKIPNLLRDLHRAELGSAHRAEVSDLGSQDFLARILMHVPAQSLHSGGSTPPEELLGEMLLEMGRPLEAQASFLAGNQRWPNRLDTLLGLARASALEGDDDEAEERYRRVLEQLACADPGHPAKAEAARAVGL